MIQLATMVVVAVSANLTPIQDTDDLFERFRAKDWEAYAKLVSIGEPVVAQLIEILADPEAENARWMAAQALGEIGTSECTIALLEALGGRDSPQQSEVGVAVAVQVRGFERRSLRRDRLARRLAGF